MDERRQAARRPFGEEVFTYLGAQRLDSTTTDISSSGAFFVTSEPLPLGEDIVLVFKKQASHEEPVFLAARVVRRQLSPRTGVGVRWTRATTQGSPQHLEWFLSSVLGVVGIQVDQEKEPDRWQMTSIYRFPEEGLPPTPQAESVGEGQGQRLPQGLIEGSLVEPVAGEEGAITRQIARSGLRAPAGLSAVLEAAAETVDVRITHLGATGMFVETALRLPRDLTGIKVTFTVPLKSQDVKVTCTCRVTGIDDGTTSGTPGLDLEFVSVDEGAHRGILRKYVRWLHFRALSTL